MKVIFRKWLRKPTALVMSLVIFISVNMIYTSANELQLNNDTVEPTISIPVDVNFDILPIEDKYVEDEVETEPVIEEVIIETEPTTEEVIIETEPVIEEPVISEESYISEDELHLLALLVMAEAEGESEEGKRLVIDVVLNRVDSERTPNTITEVIYQPGQFTSMTNGRVDICYVDEDICRLIKEELANRTNYDVMFFRTEHYHSFGTPMFQVGNHYFSSY